MWARLNRDYNMASSIEDREREPIRPRACLRDSGPVPNIIIPEHVSMRCAEFYICLTTPIYFTRSSPAPQQEERDANQTPRLGCDYDRLGGHRGCGSCVRPREPREPRRAIGHEPAAVLVDRRSDVARRRFMDLQRQLDPARRL